MEVQRSFPFSQMEDGYRLIDYGINLNDVIQLMVRTAAPKPQTSLSKKDKKATMEEEKENDKQKKPEIAIIDSTCDYYEVIKVKLC